MPCLVDRRDCILRYLGHTRDQLGPAVSIRRPEKLSNTDSNRSWTCTHRDFEYKDINFGETCTEMVSGLFVADKVLTIEYSTRTNQFNSVTVSTALELVCSSSDFSIVDKFGGS